MGESVIQAHKGKNLQVRHKDTAAISIRAPHVDNAAEISAVIELAAKFHQGSTYNNLPFSKEKIEKLLHTFADKPNAYIRIAETNGVIEGGMICMAFSPPWSDALVAQDIGLYVTPSRRGSRIAAMILEDMHKWAQGIGVKELWLGVTSGIADEAAGRLYEHFGFKIQGTLYRKVL